MVALGLLSLFLLIVTISAIVGLVRGLPKAVVRLMTLVLAVIVAFIVAGPVTNAVVQNIQIDGMTLGQMLLNAVHDMEMVGDFVESAPLLQEAVLVMPAFVVAIAVFPVVFLLLSFVSWIVFLFVNKPLRKLIFKDDATASTGKKVANRFAGMGVGVVTGMLIFGILMAPCFGLLSMLPSQQTVHDTLETMVLQGNMTAADMEVVMDEYATKDGALVKAYGFVGINAAGRGYLNSVSKIKAEGQTVYLGDEFSALFDVVQTAVEGGVIDVLMSSEDPNALYTVLSNQEFMDALMQDMFRSKLLRSAAPELMAIAMESIANTMEVPADKDAVYYNMMGSVASKVQSTEIDYAAIKAYEQVYGSAGAFAGVAAPKIFLAPADTMTKEEYEAEVKKLQALADEISAVLNKSISGDNAAFTNSVADLLVQQLLVQAAQDGQSALNSFDAAGVQAVLASINSADLAAEGDISRLLAQLTDPEQFETDVPTVQTIAENVRECVKNAVADDEKAEETASTLANVVSNFAGAISGAMSDSGEIDISKLDFDKIADAVVGLQNSTMKDVGSSVLDIVISGNVGSEGMLGDVANALKEGYENGEDIGGTIGTVGALIGMSSAMQSGGDVDMGNSLVNLINNLNDFTISLLPTIMTEDTIESMGVPAEFASTTYTVIETLLKELMKLKGADDYENEVQSILTLYNLATSGVDNFTADDIEALVGYAMNSDAICNTLKSIAVSNPFGIEIENAATRAELADAIENHYAKGDKSQRAREIYNAVATLLGIEGEVNLA
ncbi:MAG: CvpA family protein [Oscillospiraceae bacterium]|nr:CvpA family protein [Oscillospiraceae bacterium]